MRIYFIVILALVLSGCALFKDPREYDNVEYLLATKITVDSTRAIHLCSNPSKSNVTMWQHISDMNSTSLVLDEYLNNKPDSASLMQTIVNVRLMINDVLIRGNFSSTYCVEKLTNIQASSRIVERAMSQSNRAACDGGIQDRYATFTQSYTEKKISVSEYKELVNDVDRLTHVDVNSCDEVTKQKHLEDVQLMEKVASLIMAL